GRGLDRRHHVQALAAGGLDEARQLDALEPGPHLARRGDDVGEVHAGPGIEVEHQAVGAAEIADARATHVDFQRAALHQRDDAGEVVDGDDLVALFRHQMQEFSGDAQARVLLEEALAVGAFRAAHHGDDAADDMRPHPFPDLFVILGEVALADAGIAPIDAVGMRELDGAEHGGRAPAAGGAPLCQARPGRPHAVFSRTTCLAGLSWRTPWNEACRTRSPWVQPRKSTSTTIFGSTQIGPRRPRSSLGTESSGESRRARALSAR